MNLSQFIRRLAVITIATLGATQLAACNTMEGAGKDIEKGGEKIQDAAN